MEWWGGKTRKIVGILIMVRITNTIIQSSFFGPDEFFQSLEIAHKMVFGFGEITWEWFPNNGLRSFLHPLIFAAPFKLLQITGMDNSYLIIIIPKIIQALFASLIDYSTLLLSSRFSSSSSPPSSLSRLSLLTLIASLTSWFTFYTGVRTLSNSLESLLVTAALASLDWNLTMKKKGKKKRKKKKKNEGFSLFCLFGFFGGLSVAIRPTSVIPLAPAYLCYLFRLDFQSQIKSILRSVTTGLFVVFLAGIIDSWFYGQPTCVLLNFLKFNFFGIGGGADFYGTHPWHWYLTQGLPVVLGPYLPLFLYGVYTSWQEKRPDRLLIVPIGVCVFVLSLLGHKEFRFLSSILPLMLIFVARGMDAIATAPKTPWKTKKRFFLLVLIFTNIPIALYFSCFHQVGVMSLTNYIRSNENIESVDYLMPCHSTPLYSHIHRPIPLSYLHCPPPIGLKKGSIHYDQADDFYNSPLAFLENYYFGETKDLQPYEEGYQKQLPSHLAIFDSLFPHIATFLQQQHFTLETSFFHTFTPIESRQGERVLLFRKN